jgi:hypothetical protein
MIKGKEILFTVLIFAYSFAYSNNFDNTFQLSSPIYFGFQSKITNLYWFATGMGISSFDGQKFENYESQNPFFGLGCYKLIEDNLGRVWFCTSNGNIVFYNGYEFKKIIYTDQIYKLMSNSVITDLRFYNGEILLLIHHNIILDSFHIISIKLTDLRKYKIKSTILNFTKKFKYWVAKYNNNPIVIMDSSKSEKFYQVNGTRNIFFSNRRLLDSDKYSIVFDYKKNEINNVKFQNNHYLISTSSNGLIYDNIVKKELSKHQYENISCSFYDNENNIVLTSLNYKVIFVPKYSVKEILLTKMKEIVKIKGQHRKIYLVDMLYDLWIYDPSKRKKKLISHNYSKNYVDRNIFFRNNIIYFNKRKIIQGKFNKGKNIDFTPFQLYEHIDSINLISTGYADVKVVNKMDKRKRILFYGKRVYDAKIDAKGVLWVATISGLYFGKIDFQNNWKIKSFEILFKDKIVEDIQFYNNMVFVLVNRKSINIVSNKIHYNILDSSILKNKVINKYLFIGKNAILLGTNVGLCYMEFQLENSIFKIRRSSFMGGFKGVFSNEIVDFDTLDNLIYFASKNRLFTINMKYWESANGYNKCHFRSVITSKRVFDIVDLKNKIKLKLENDENTLDVNIINSYYNKPDIDELYRYYLVYNNDTSYMKYSNAEMIKFYNLKFGNYKLIIQSRNNMNQWGEFSILQFNIKPKFTETTVYFCLFVISVIVLISIFLYLFFANKQKKIINNSLALESENYQLQLLKSQLNPHFLFNSLNSLKGLVYLERKELALDYTDRLSVFLRNILSSNQGLECVLAEELIVIGNYIEVERIRLDDKIELELECEDSLKHLPIPSNILQPIVENCVKYGYSPSNEKLMIRLACQRHGAELWIIVDDNGKGIMRHSGNKDSFSLEAIRKRIDKFNKGRIKENFSLSDILLEGQVIGVRAIIKIRIYEDINR